MEMERMTPTEAEELVPRAEMQWEGEEEEMSCRRSATLEGWPSSMTTTDVGLRGRDLRRASRAEKRSTPPRSAFHFWMASQEVSSDSGVRGVSSSKTFWVELPKPTTLKAQPGGRE